MSQDADIVSFIYRPEYYGITTDEESGDSLTGIGEIIIAKHRNGSLENVKLRFIGEYAKFENLDTYDNLGGGTMLPNSDFDSNPGTMTLPSKGWEDEDDFSEDEDAPF